MAIHDATTEKEEDEQQEDEQLDPDVTVFSPNDTEDINDQMNLQDWAAFALQNTKTQQWHE